jgi:hypothetical protein
MHVRRSAANRRRRVTAVVASVSALVATCATFAGAPAPAGADTIGVDFESYSTGSVDGQDGWTSWGAYDVEVSDNSTIPGAPASFGDQSLRMSDAVTSGSFGDQTFSKPTVDAAGEPTADDGGYPVGTLQTAFLASFDFASVTPGAEQPGLHTTASPDRGDGARMSYVRIDDTAGGWNLSFYDYQDVAPLGSQGDLDDGCSTGDDFIQTQFATGVSRATPHNLQFVMNLVPGAHNDVVKIFLDGSLVHTGTSWEDYFRFCDESGGGEGGPLADQSRIVRNLLFRQAGTAHPANDGAGFLIDNMVLTTASAPDAPTIGTATAGDGEATVSWTAPGFDGGTPITGYVVTPYIGAVAQTPQVFNDTATTQTITGLANGTTYTFKVAATNLAGTGAESAASNAVTPQSASSGCNASNVPAALISWYPANPGAQSALKVACRFNNQTGASQVSPSFTIHDANVAQYHNGASRTVTVSAASSGATSLTASPSITGTGLGTWVNRVITGPGLAPRTFVTSIAGDTLNLSRPTAAAISGGTSYRVENAAGARSVDDATSSSPDLLNSSQANFTAGDVGLSVTGTGIPANTTILAVNTPTQAQLSSSFTLTGPTVSIGGTLLSTSTRQVTGASITSTVRINSTIAAWASSDVGLEVSGVCDQVTDTTSDDYTIPAGTYILTTPSGANADTTGGLTAGQTGCNLTVGDPNGNAPADGEVAAQKGLQLDLSPSLVPGSNACADDQPEGIALTGTWRNPGSFAGSGVTNRQPGPTESDPGGAATKAVGQILFDTSVADYSAFIVERRALTPGDPIGVVHYDVVFPFVPTGLALCPTTSTSPALGMSLTILSATGGQAALPTGTGRPGTGQLRSILPSASGGYTSTAYVRSDSAVLFSPSSAFQRVCAYPTGLPNPINFQCGPG